MLDLSSPITEDEMNTVYQAAFDIVPDNARLYAVLNGVNAKLGKVLGRSDIECINDYMKAQGPVTNGTEQQG